MNIKGIDVSVWQGKIDWKKVKAGGIVFAMIRVGYGSSQGDNCKMDTYFKANVEGALAAGVEAGIYFYSYAKSAQAAAKEAAWVVKQIAPYKGRILYPIAYDLEDNKQAGLGRDVLTAMVTAFCTTIEAAGYYASFYCNTNWCKNMLNMDDLKGFDLWLAQWASQPTTAYSFGMWQRSSSGSVAGINGRVDLDVAYKDYAAIIKRTGLNGYKETAQPAQEPEKPAQPTETPDVNDTRKKIVRKAIGELGVCEPTGDDKYIRWYNTEVLKTWSLPLDAAWCAMWVSYVTNYLAGIARDIVKPYCGCSTGMAFFKAQGVFHPSAACGGTYTPLPADIAFFKDKKSTAESTHTGLVEYVKDGVLHTIEGNTSNAVKRRQYDLNDTYIVGYAAPNYGKENIDSMTKAELKQLIREVIAEDNPTYADLKDVPAYWQEQAKALLDAGAVNGGTPADVNPTDLNLRHETLKAVIIASLYHDANTPEK